MTELTITAGRAPLRRTGPMVAGQGWRLLVLAALAALAASGEDLRGIVLGAIADAYLAVTVFVAGTLALVYLFERVFRFDLGQAMARARGFQAPVAAALGALPGCGGAIIVVTQYTRGLVSFGSVVSVLIATMGDAAFLLLAREPVTGLGVMAVGFVVGSLCGWLVDWLHGPDFMRARAGGGICPAFLPGPESGEQRSLLAVAARRLWVVLIVPGAALGLLLAVQFETDVLFGSVEHLEPTLLFGVAGGLLCLAMWGLATEPNAHAVKCPYQRSRQSLGTRVIKDTNFVTSWVVLGFLTYELGVHFAGAGIEAWLQVGAPLVPLVAVLVGFIPGCGPQIVVTSLYLSNAIPLSAQLGNAISNDGDALFPALAMAPRAAVLATLYSAVPALIVAYGWHLLFE